jgi:hypothetical protein
MLLPKRGSAVQTRAWMGISRALPGWLQDNLSGGQEVRDLPLCPVRREGHRQRLPLRRRHRPRSRGDHRRGPRQQDGPHRHRPQGERINVPAHGPLFRQIANNGRPAQARFCHSPRPVGVGDRSAIRPCRTHRPSQCLRNDGERSRPVHPRLFPTEGQYACDDQVRVRRRAAWRTAARCSTRCSVPTLPLRDSVGRPASPRCL